MSTLPSLPTEILHRIFDYFDTKTQFQSVKLTCKRLHSAVNTYNRIKIEQCAKKNLVRVCTNVSPEHIIYLSCNEDYSVPDSFFSISIKFDGSIWFIKSIIRRFILS